MGIIKVYCILPYKLYQRGEFTRFSRAEKQKFLSSWGITVVVSLYGSYDSDLGELSRDGMLNVETGVIRYIHHPIADGKRVGTVSLEKLAGEVTALIQKGECALLTCHAGRNRSGLLSTLVVRQLLRISGKEALAFVRAHRARAVANEAFVKYLEALPAP